MKNFCTSCVEGNGCPHSIKTLSEYSDLRRPGTDENLKICDRCGHKFSEHAIEALKDSDGLGLLDKNLGGAPPENGLNLRKPQAYLDRDKLVLETLNKFESNRVISLRGPPGLGKTSLAQLLIQRVNMNTSLPRNLPFAQAVGISFDKSGVLAIRQTLNGVQNFASMFHINDEQTGARKLEPVVPTLLVIDDAQHCFADDDPFWYFLKDEGRSQLHKNLYLMICSTKVPHVTGSSPTGLNSCAVSEQELRFTSEEGSQFYDQFVTNLLPEEIRKQMMDPCVKRTLLLLCSSTTGLFIGYLGTIFAVLQQQQKYNNLQAPQEWILSHDFITSLIARNMNSASFTHTPGKVLALLFVSPDGIQFVGDFYNQPDLEKNTLSGPLPRATVIEDEEMSAESFKLITSFMATGIAEFYLDGKQAFVRLGIPLTRILLCRKLWSKPARLEESFQGLVNTDWEREGDEHNIDRLILSAVKSFKGQDIASQSKGSSTHFPKEGAFQQMLYKELHKLVNPTTCIVSELSIHSAATVTPNLGEMTEEKGSVDFYLNSSLQFAIEIVRVGSQSVKQHVERFLDPGNANVQEKENGYGKYYNLRPRAWRVVYFTKSGTRINRQISWKNVIIIRIDGDEAHFEFTNGMESETHKFL